MKKRHLQTNFLMFLVEKYEKEIQVLKKNNPNHLEDEEVETFNKDGEISNENPKDEIASSNNNIIKNLTQGYKNKVGK